MQNWYPHVIVQFCNVCSCWNYAVSTKIHISQRFERCLARYICVGGFNMSRFIVDEMRMQNWRGTELLQMLEVTATGSHAGSQALGEVRHSLVDVFLWQLFPDGLQPIVLGQ